MIDKVPFLIRLKLAHQAFKLKDFQVYYGPYRKVNTLVDVWTCDYPKSTSAIFGGNKKALEKAACGEVVTDCIGRDGIQLMIGLEKEDIHVCKKHQKSIREEMK